MELFGRSYVIDHCVAEIKKENELEVYRVYITDCLRLIAKNVAPIAHGEYIGKRYAEIIHPKPEETRTAEEIIDSIKQKLARS